MFFRRAAVSAVAVFVLAGCGGSSGSSDSSVAAVPTSPQTDTEASEVTDAPTVTQAPSATEAPAVTEAPVATDAPVDTAAPAETIADVGRVVVLAEEGVLADVVDLGIPVVASSATVPDAGFQGMGDLDATGIEIFDYLSIGLEELATMEADHVIVWEFLVDEVGAEQLAGVGSELHVIPNGSSGREQLELLAEWFDRTDRATEMLAELDAAYDDARSQVAGECAASIVAIYAGPNVAAFAGPVWDVPRAVDELGCDLVPAADGLSPDGNGRVWLSLEQLGLLDGPELIMLQTSSVEGEQAAIDDVTGSPLWSQLPAVQSGDVTTLDRLGYAGIDGEIRLLDDIVGILA